MTNNYTLVCKSKKNNDKTFQGFFDYSNSLGLSIQRAKGDHVNQKEFIMVVLKELFSLSDKKEEFLNAIKNSVILKKSSNVYSINFIIKTKNNDANIDLYPFIDEIESYICSKQNKKKLKSKNTRILYKELFMPYVVVLFCFLVTPYYYNILYGNEDIHSDFETYNFIFQVLFIVLSPVALFASTVLAITKKGFAKINHKVKGKVLDNSIFVVSTTLSGFIIDTIYKNFFGTVHDGGVFCFVIYILLAVFISIKIENNKV